MNSPTQEPPKTRNLGSVPITSSAIPRFGQGGNPTGCPGIYQAIARFPAPDGLMTWTAPAGSTSCRITDVTPGMPGTYISRVEAVKVITQVACGQTTVTFPVTAGSKYTFTIYVINVPPPPTAGQSLNLQVEWLP
ncbi:MAG: hypothetical protein JNL97_10330 [Verrucomicrobiales bacterium]|nr:hypothetical protein [Verrucomicrobiales bacterium]